MDKSNPLLCRIAAIESRCREVLEMDGKAAKGPWKSFAEALYASVEGPSLFCAGVGNTAGWDATFIATSRTLCPALARAMLTAIEAFRFIANVDYEETDEPAPRTAMNALESIGNLFDNP